MNKRQKRVQAIAKQMNRSWSISMRQCMEEAERMVSEWENAFSPGSLKRHAAGNNPPTL